MGEVVKNEGPGLPAHTEISKKREKKLRSEANDLKKKVSGPVWGEKGAWRGQDGGKEGPEGAQRTPQGPPRAPQIIDGTPGRVIFWCLGPPKILDLRSKIKQNRTEGTEGLVPRI